MRLGIVGPLPPTPTGPASYLARMLPALSQLADPVLFVDDPLAVDPGIRDRWPVRHVDERFGAGLHCLMYHLANNPMHSGVLAAALAGPPGVVVLHDASLHHLLTHDLVATGRLEEYGAWLAQAHGSRGSALGALRLYGGTEIEQFVFDAVAPVLDRHLGVVTHSRYAADIVEHRCPGLPTYVVPHFAPSSPSPPEPLPGDDDACHVVIGHFGYVTKPKRYVELLHAMRAVVDSGVDAHLVFAGEDASRGHLDVTIRDLRLTEHVTVTGWIDDAAFDALLQRVDIAVSLRWPQVGESSGTLASLLGAGKVTVVEDVGSWAELPRDVVVRIDSTDMRALGDALVDLCRSPRRRREIGAAARTYSAAQLGVERCAAAVVVAVASSASQPMRPPSQVVADRTAAIGGVMGGGIERVTAILGPLMSAHHPPEDEVRWLRTVPPARPGATLVDLRSTAPRANLLREVWGYNVLALTRIDPLRHGSRHVRVPAAGGLPEAAVVLTPASLACRLPIGAGAADVVLAWEVAELAGPYAAHLLMEINRILAPRGILALSAALSARLETLLDAAGLAVVDADGSLDQGTLATKVGLPAEDCPVYA